MKIYVDSRWRTVDSPSASDFTYELLESVDLRNAKLHVRDVTVPVTWRTVEELNRYLYVLERWTNGSASRYRVLTLPLGQYDPVSLQAALASALNGADSLFVGSGSPYLVSYSDQTGQITVRLNVPNAGWTLFTDQALGQVSSAAWPFASGSPVMPMSFNRNLRLSVQQEYDSTRPYVSQFVDLMTVKDLYICSSTFSGSTDTVGPMPGTRDTLAKVGCNQGYGYILTGQEQSYWEFISIGNRLLKRMSFQLRDVSGAIVPLHGCDWSFCLHFDTSDV
jgi:hypothetical protein